MSKDDEILEQLRAAAMTRGEVRRLRKRYREDCQILIRTMTGVANMLSHGLPRSIGRTGLVKRLNAAIQTVVSRPL